MNNLQTQNQVKNLLSQESIKTKFQEILKDRAAGFTANLAVMVNNNEMLKKCDPLTVVSAAVISASLDLPLDPNLGFAAIVPYKTKKNGTYVDVAQFQIMYKGFVQLAMRSGQYQTIGVSPIYDGQLISENPLTSDYVFDFNKKESDKIIGHAAYFRLTNGFEKTVYWPIEKIDKHGQRFSKTYGKDFGLWKKDFESMANKTVLKNLLSKWGYLSIEMQKAVKFDQGVIKNEETGEVEYADVQEIKSFDDSDPIQAKKIENGAAE